MSTLLKFIRGANSLQFLAPADYPAGVYSEKIQVIDRTAGATLQVEELGINIKRRVLNFDLMPVEDFEGLENWFDNVVNGSYNNFTFIDEKGISRTARFLNPVLDFKESSFENYTGSFTLEFE